MGDGWKDGHHVRWLAGFERHLFPRTGKKPVDKVDSACFVEALSPIWLEIPETARRFLQRIGVVLDFSHPKGWVTEEVSLRSVRKGLPRQNDKRGHMEAMSYADVPALMQKLATASPTTGRDALRFTIYNAVRSNENRLAVWTEFDLENAVWTISDERMKAGETHLVPLSAQVVALLRKRWNERINDTGLVFSNDGKKPISDMTMTKLLRDDGFASITVHGFRSTFTDWAAEYPDFPKEVAEKQMGSIRGGVVTAPRSHSDIMPDHRSTG